MTAKVIVPVIYAFLVYTSVLALFIVLNGFIYFGCGQTGKMDKKEKIKIYPFSLDSITCWKTWNGCAPLTSSPLIKNPGVP